jgi:hypothetical protein
VSAAERTMVLQRFFDLLDERAIDYCVVGDHRALQHEVHSDVDIVMPNRQLTAVPALMGEFAGANGLALVQDIQHEIDARYFVYSWKDSTGEVQFLPIDICGDWYREARRFMTADDLLDGRQFEERTTADGQVFSFWRPASSVNFLYYLLKKIDKGTLSEHACDLMRAEFAADPLRTIALLRRYFRSPSRELLSAYIESDDWESVRGSLRVFRRDLQLDEPVRWLEWLRLALRQLRPTGLLLVIPQAQPGADALASHIAGVWAHAFRRVESLRRGRVGWWFYLRRARHALVRSTLVLVEAPRVSRALTRFSDTLALSAEECRNIDVIDRHISEHLFTRLKRRPNGRYL